MASSRSPSAASRGASFGWIATPPSSASNSRTTPSVQRADGRSQPIWIIRGTPTAAAFAIWPATGTASTSTSLVKSRCVWLSTTGDGSGSGAGGQARSARGGIDVVEPREQRGSLRHGRTRGELPELPGPRDRLRTEGAQSCFGAERCPQSLRGLRRDRVQQHGEGPQRLGRGDQDRGETTARAALGRVLGHVPRFLLGEVPVSYTHLT